MSYYTEPTETPDFSTMGTPEKIKELKENEKIEKEREILLGEVLKNIGSINPVISNLNQSTTIDTIVEEESIINANIPQVKIFKSKKQVLDEIIPPDYQTRLTTLDLWKDYLDNICFKIFHNNQSYIGYDDFIKDKCGYKTEYFKQKEMAEQFSHITIPIHVNNNTIKNIQVFPWWFNNISPASVYNREEFIPGYDNDKNKRPGTKNTWKGHAYEPNEHENWDDYKQWIKADICNGSQESWDVLFNWMAKIIQCSDFQCTIIPVIVGESGSGKGFFFEKFAELIGGIYSREFSSIKDLCANFNSDLEHCLFAYVNETEEDVESNTISNLKNLATCKYLKIEGKHANSKQVKRYVQIGLTSDRIYTAIAMDIKDRRFYILPTNPNSIHINDEGFFLDHKAKLERGGFSRMIYDLFNHKLGTSPDDPTRKVSLTSIANNNASQSMKVNSSPVFDYLLNSCENNYWEYNLIISCRDAYNDFKVKYPNNNINNQTVFIDNLIHYLKKTDGTFAVIKKKISVKDQNGVNIKGRHVDGLVFESSDNCRKVLKSQLGDNSLTEPPTKK